MKKAYSYIRFSNPEQIKGDSLRRQLKLSEDYAKEKGLVLDQTLNLQDLGVSGFKGDNVTKGAFGAFLKAIEKKLIEPGSVLLVESLDRISRDQITDQMTLFMNIINAGITIVTLTDRMSYSKTSINDNFTGLMYSLMIMSRAHEESATKSKRVRAAWQNKRAQNKILTGRCPTWLRLNKQKQVFETIEDRCAVIRRIYEMAGRGIGYYTISRTLHKDKVSTWGRAKTWQISYIKSVLESRAVIGEFQVHHFVNGKREPLGDMIKNYFPKVIPDELFFKVRHRIESSRVYQGKTGRNVSNLFAGIAKCGYTGSPMVFIWQRKTGALVASNARFGFGGKFISWIYKSFETSFLTFVRELDYSSIEASETGSKLTEINNNLLLRKDELDQVTKKITNLVDAIADGKLESKALTGKLASLEHTQTTIEKAIKDLESEKATEEELKNSFQQDKAVLEGLLAKREDQQVRYQLRLLFRQQIERIDVFAGGFRWNKDLWYKMFPLSNPMRVLAMAKCHQKLIDAGYIDSTLKLQVADMRNPDWNEAWANYFPTNKAQRCFVVHFKNGVIKFVKSDYKDPSKVSAGWMDNDTKPTLDEVFYDEPDREKKLTKLMDELKAKGQQHKKVKKSKKPVKQGKAKPA